MFLRIKWFTNDTPSGSVSVSNLQVLGMPIDSRSHKYLFCLGILVVLALLAKNLVRGASAASGWRSATWTSPPP
jgi:branched-chain amino acid transport system permease protein